MTGLDIWLHQATRHLAKDSAVQIRAEILEHYECIRETALAGGATALEADRSALVALGDAKAANFQYRQVLLTSDEARMLREGNWEARVVCARPWMKWTLLAMPVAAIVAAVELFVRGAIEPARVVSGAALGTACLCAVLFLPIYTPLRGCIFRCVKWIVLVAIFAIVLGPDLPKFSWLLASCVWPMAWIEWKRASIRRKMPVSSWPKHLYL
jgi:hypothetical protein